MKNLLALAPLLAVSVLLASGPSQEDPAKRLMRAKAGYAHRLLDAVVQEDFDAMRDQALRLIAVAETADWRVVDTPEYVKESDAFIVATQRLLEEAKEENGDAAALAYMNVTLSCVHCHRYVEKYIRDGNERKN